MTETQFHTRSGILKATLSALLSWLGDEYRQYGQNELKVYLVRNVTDMRQPGRLKNKQSSEEAPIQGEEQNDTVESPMLRIALGDFSIDGTKGGFRKQRANNGVVLGIDKDQGIAYTDSMTPVNVTLGARFDSADLEDILIFVTMLFEARPKVSFSFVTEAGTTWIETSVTFEASLTVPQADFSTGGMYSLETIFTMSTYVGKITQQRIIKAVRVTTAAPSNSSAELSIDKLTSSLYESDVMKYYSLFDKSSPFFKYPDAEG